MAKRRRRAKNRETTNKEQKLREGKRLEAIEIKTNQVLASVDKIEKAFTNELLPRATTVMDNVDTVMEKSHIWLDMGTVLLTLLAIFGLRCLRSRTGNSLFAICGNYLMGCLQCVLGLFCTLQILALVYMYVTGETMEKEMLMQLAAGVMLGLILLVVFVHYRLVRNQNNIGNRNGITIYRQNPVAQAIG